MALKTLSGVFGSQGWQFFVREIMGFTVHKIGNFLKNAFFSIHC